MKNDPPIAILGYSADTRVKEIKVMFEELFGGII